MTVDHNEAGLASIARAIGIPSAQPPCVESTVCGRSADCLFFFVPFLRCQARLIGSAGAELYPLDDTVAF